MKEKWKVKYWVDFFMLLFLLATATTGLNLFLSDIGNAKFLGVSGEKWRAIHPILGITTAAFVVVHLLLHLDWIKQISKKIFGSEKTPDSQ